MKKYVSIFILTAILVISGLGYRKATSSAEGTLESLPDETGNALNTSSSMLALSPDGGLLLVVNPDSNSLSFVDTSTDSCSAEIPVGVDPRSVVISGDGSTAYVTNQGSDSLSVVDISAQEVLTDVSVGDRPVGLAISPGGQVLAVAEMGDDTVRLLNTVDLSIRSIVAVADRPHGLAFTPDGRRLLITHLLSGELTVLDLEPRMVFLPVVVGSSQVMSSHLQVGGDAKIWQVNPIKSTIATWLNVAPAPSVIVNASGTRAYVPQTMANGQGLNTQFDTTVFPKVSVINLENNKHQTSEHIPLPETDQPVGLPWDVALAKGDTELWVVNSASNDVSVVSIINPSRPTRVANIPVGDHPRGIRLGLDENTAYVNNTLAGTISVIDANTYTVTQVITITTSPLPPALLNGKRLFFSSARSDLALARWISCNTCHIEGEQDGRTWKLQYLGEVPPGEKLIITRNTTSLLGMIETYPLRWSAEWDESADSEFSIRFEQFGAGLIQGQMHPTLGDPNQGRSYDLDCLAMFIDSLVVPPRTHSLSDAEQRGKVIFESPTTQCVVCHPAPLYTDLQVHDVGTADAHGEWFGPLIDTPTLRFLYDSAPFLHDGSATTLFEVLTVKNQADEHGVTSHLTEQELADLTAFLLVLP